MSFYIGTNGKMNEICAAMGLTSLESLEQFIAVSYRNYQTYRQELQAIRGVRLLEYDEGERNNYQYIVLEMTSPRRGEPRSARANSTRGECHGSSLLLSRMRPDGAL